MPKSFTQLSTKDLVAYFKKLDPKTRKKLALIFGGVCLFVAFIFWPAWIQRPLIGFRTKDLRSQIQLGKARIAQQPKLLAERKEHEAFVTDAQSRLLKSEEGEGIVGILASLADKSQATLVSTEPQSLDQNASEKFPPPYDSKYRRISYLVTLEGGYHPLATFVSALENHPKIFRVSEFSITPKEESPKIHLAQVVISAFTLQTQPKPGGGK